MGQDGSKTQLFDAIRKHNINKVQTWLDTHIVNNREKTDVELVLIINYIIFNLLTNK